MAVSFTDNLTTTCEECGLPMYITYKVRLGIDPATLRHYDRDAHKLYYEGNPENEPCVNYYTKCWRCMLKGYMPEAIKARYSKETGEYITSKGTHRMCGGRLLNEEDGAKLAKQQKEFNNCFDY